MILVTLGTQDKEFTRLLEAIDKEIEKKNIKEKVIVQAGYTKYQSNNMEIFDLISSDELEKLVKECRLLITHGGVGSILMGIKNHKPVIAAARLKEHKEHTNNHQKQIISEFKERGYILELDDFSKLDQVLKQAQTFKAKKFVSHTDQFVKNIEDYIKEDNHKSWLNKVFDLVSCGHRNILASIINVVCFIILDNYFNIISSVVFSFIITTIIEVVFNFLPKIKYRKSYYICIKLLTLLLDIILIVILDKFITSIVLSKILCNIIVLLISHVISNYHNFEICNLEDENI